LLELDDFFFCGLGFPMAGQVYDRAKKRKKVSSMSEEG
jgi:hypothetical protein